MPDVIQLLETDHREVDDLFAKAEENTGAAKQQVVTKLIQELTIHAEAEEQIVYPAMKAAGLDDLVKEAESEHQEAKQLIAKLETMDLTTADVDEVLAQLKAGVQHHVQEEESEALPRFRSASDQGTLDKLGTQLEEFKQSRQ